VVALKNKFMKSIKIVVLVMLLSGSQLFAQNARFVTEGTIEYYKRVNMFALIKKNYSDNSFYLQAFEAYKKNQPQFRILKSTLSFAKDKTLFAPVKAKESQSNGFFSGEPAAQQNNLIYTDFSTGLSTIQKTVYEETFLLKDTTRKITWKITDETREIAGYSCRRANAIMMDSIYVVAFYTDKIAVSGGPESFSGLPGMILGVALPHENMTWFATKVTDASIPAEVIKMPVKGKPMTSTSLKVFLANVLKDWGDSARSILKGFLL
jgi:GLPGLI family protein